MKKITPNLLCLTLLLIAGCTGAGNVDSADDLGLRASGQPVEKPLPAEDPLYSSMPTGPINTGTYPNFGDEPAARISAGSRSQANSLMSRLSALETAQRRGTISQSTYQRRMVELRHLAARHSPEMLERIEARTSN